jgi:hypothetical protein
MNRHNTATRGRPIQPTPPRESPGTPSPPEPGFPRVALWRVRAELALLAVIVMSAFLALAYPGWPGGGS